MKRRDEKLLNEYKLSDEEIKKAIDNGLLSSGIRYLITYPEKDGYYHHRPFYNDKYFQSLGIRTYYAKWKNNLVQFEFIYKSFYVTDFYLLCYDGKLDSKYIKEKFVYTHPDSFIVIPLDKIESITIKFEKNKTIFGNATFKEVKKSPVAGAAVGALIAGAPGAVAGAALNSGTKKVMVSSGYINKDYYSLIIKFENGEEYYYDNYYEIDARIEKEKNLYKFLLDKKNEETAIVLEQSKIKRTLEEKKQIVSDTINKKEDASNPIDPKVKIFIILVIIVSIIIGILIGMNE